MNTVQTDVLVVGSGFGAAAPALRLGQAGYRVVMVEKGPFIDPGRDFRQTQDPRYLLRYFRTLSGRNLTLLFVEALGGGSGFYEMISLRAPRQVFVQRDMEGYRLWPAGIDRAALDPYYGLAEEMLRVAQIPPGQVPKSGLVFSLLMKNLGYSCDRARYAVRGCVGSGFCVSGCIYGAKQSLHLNYLPQAVAAGADIVTGVEAISVRSLRPRAVGGEGLPLSSLPHRYEVLCQSTTAPHEQTRYRARLVVLAGGTVGTAALLLRSRPHLPHLSPHVGRNVTFNAPVKVGALLPDGFPEGDMFTGLSHPGMISYHFLESHGITICAGKVHPLQLVHGQRLKVAGDARSPVYWGEPHVEIMRRYRTRMMALVAHGLTPPAATLSADARGRPQLVLPVTHQLRTYQERTRALLEDILLRNGCTLLETAPHGRDALPGENSDFGTAHPMGSCRMADSRQRGVIDREGEVFGYPGLYVCDGAAIPSSLAVSPSLTILANAERIAAGVLARHPLRTTRTSARWRQSSAE